MKLTKQQILKLNPCQDFELFAKSCDLEAVKIWQTCQRGDWLIWLLQKTNQLDKPQSVRVATCCAKHVLGMYEEKYPGDKRPRTSIAAAKAYLENPSEENRVAASAYADASAACASDADHASAYAASHAAADSHAAAASHAAYAAAYAASHAASAAAYAADYADYSAASAADYSIGLSERKWQADKIRELIPCPFENSI